MLAQLAAPTVALVNNAQREHQEFMASVEGAARENGAVIAALPADGTAVFPADDDFTPLWRQLAGTRPVWTFALQGPADVTACAAWDTGAWRLVLATPAGRAEARLALPGLHNVRNALAAAACALAAGAPLAAVTQGIDGFRAVKGRSRVLRGAVPGQGRHAFTLVDDSYNANPDSVRAAIDVLADAARSALAAAGRHGRGRRPGRGLPRRGRVPMRARAASSTCGAPGRCAPTPRGLRRGARHFATVESLLAALQSACRAAKPRRCWSRARASCDGARRAGAAAGGRRRRPVVSQGAPCC
jgi:UDP-N-acetylmuramoyl-tripeptide--D-alanyl-D-alanine ligase